MSNLKVWEPEIDVVMPIMYEDIPGFKKWVKKKHQSERLLTEW
jgi:hypothetical protein